MKIRLPFIGTIRPALIGAIAVATIVLPQVARADEGGVSFWLPGLFGSLAAAPATPGWSLGVVSATIPQ